MVSRHFFDLVFYKAFAELRTENSRAMGGYLWWVMEPLMTLGVYFAVFSFLRQGGTGDFVIFLFIGIVFWRWFQASVMRSASSLILNRELMLQVDLHKMIPPLSVVIIDTVKFSITFLLLIVMVFSFGGGANLAWFSLPVLLITQIFLITGCACFVAAVTPVFPDFAHILSTLMMLMMFCSGVFYPISIVPERVQWVLLLNPMTVLIMQYRDVFLEAKGIDALRLLGVWLEVVVIFALGAYLLHKYNKVYPKIC